MIFSYRENIRITEARMMAEILRNVLMHNNTVTRNQTHEVIIDNNSYEELNHYRIAFLLE